MKTLSNFNSKCAQQSPQIVFVADKIGPPNYCSSFFLQSVVDYVIGLTASWIQNPPIRYLQHYVSKLKVIPIEPVAWDWGIQKLHGGHHCWMSWPALDKGNLLQPSSASTRESENSWPKLWPPCFLRRLTWVPAETMTLSTHSALNLTLRFQDVDVWADLSYLRITIICWSF